MAYVVVNLDGKQSEVQLKVNNFAEWFLDIFGWESTRKTFTAI